MAAKVLTEAGADVVMLEAGPMWDPVQRLEDDARGTTTRRAAARRPRSAHVRRVRRRARRLDARRRALHQRAGQQRSTGSARGCSAAGPTTGAASRCASVRTTSGARALDGLGDDWPITYDDIKPYYDKVDKLVGIFGTNLGPRLPNEPDGIFLPPPQPRCYELLIKQASDEAEHPVRAVAAVDPDASRSTAARRATTAASAAAAARRTRTSRRRRC